MSTRGTSEATQIVFLTAWKEHIDEKAESVHKALAFLDICKESPGATETGSFRDAREWIESSTRELLAAIAHLPSEKWGRP